MFSGRSNLVICLKSQGHIHSQFSHEERRFSIYFLISSPTLVPSHIQDRSIDICISEKTALTSGNISYLTDKFLVPGVTDAQLRRKICCHQGFHTAYSLIGKVDRDSKTGSLYEESLYLIQRPGVSGSRETILIFSCWQAPTVETIQMFIDSTYSVLP